MRTKILTIFFILLITSQVYGLALTAKVTLNEKRLLAKAPELKPEQLFKSSYYSRLGRFLDDRYPYRRPFIIAKNWIDYYIFYTSPSPKVHIGTDGWLYMRSSLTGYIRDECDKKRRAIHLARTLHSIEKLFASENKRFFFIVAPDKDRIYPEHLGFKRPKNTCGKNFYGLFLEALEKYPLQGFIRLDKILVEAKKDYLIYYKKGTHWNYRGAMIASSAILQRLSTTTDKYRLPEIKFKQIEDLRDLTTLWGLNLTETVDVARFIKRNKKVKTKNLTPLANGRPRLQMTNTSATGHSLLPPTLIYRDSFMTIPLKFMKGSFEKIDAIWTRKIPATPETDYPALRSAEIIIIEAVERNLYRLQIRKNDFASVLMGSTGTREKQIKKVSN